MKDEAKAIKKKGWKKFFIIPVLLVFLLICMAGILFIDEIKIMASVKRISDDKPVYIMEINGDYYFEDFLNSGGASSDEEVSAYLTKRISKGFYSVNVENKGLACSTLSAKAPDGTHIWGRNFDWVGSVPIIVKCAPQNGYASISTCDFQNVIGNPDVVPEGIVNKMISIAALYVPLDGINEVGLCVADLEVNEGGMVSVNTEKPDLTITTAIRLLLNKAAGVDEAVELLKQYDIHPSGGISHHLAISDAAGKSVVVEFRDGELDVIQTNSVTNFNFANGNTAAGGESAQKRYELLNAVYQENIGIFTAEQMKNVLSQVSQSGEKWNTQWSIVYEQNAFNASYYFYGDYETVYRFSMKDF